MNTLFLDQTYWFFEYGSVSVINTDTKSRQASFIISMPAIIAHTITPALLGSGLIDQYTLMDPQHVWMPTIHPNRFNDDIKSEIIDSINMSIKSSLSNTIKLFNCVGQTLLNQSDLIPMLPLGIYVKFRLRCSIDELAISLEELGKTDVTGVAEFRYALASSLKDILIEFNNQES